MCGFHDGMMTWIDTYLPLFWGAPCRSMLYVVSHGTFAARVDQNFTNSMKKSRDAAGGGKNNSNNNNNNNNNGISSLPSFPSSSTSGWSHNMKKHRVIRTFKQGDYFGEWSFLTGML